MHYPRDQHDCIDFHGLSLDVINATDSGLVCHVESRTDPHETRLALQLARPGDHVLVAGAGFGGTLALLAQKLGSDAVVGYEPNPLAHAGVHIRLLVRGQPLHIVPAALGVDDGGDVPFYLADDWPCSSFDPGWAATQGRRVVSVKRVALQRALATEQATALVLDVEGNEIDMLATLAPGTLRWLVCELHGHDRPALGRAADQACARLGLRMQERIDGAHTLVFAGLRR